MPMVALFHTDLTGQATTGRGENFSQTAQTLPIRILLLEDNDSDAVLERLSLKDSLLGAISVARAVRVSEALALQRDQGVDIAVIDLTLPDATGAEAMLALRALQPDLPIVVVTGSSDPQVPDSVLGLGAQDFVHKDRLLEGQLARAVRFALLRAKAERHRNMAAPSLSPELVRHELSSARRMQMALLPDPEAVAAFGERNGVDMAGLLEPSLAIGGDLWGALDLGDGRMAVYAFDFSGHGIAAALNTFRLHTLIHDHRELAHAPHEMLSRLDATLAPLLPKGQFATLFYAVMDVRDNTLTWSSAGAPAPVFLPKDGPPEFLDSRGFLMGLSTSLRRGVNARPMLPGDSLVLYSDAVPESMDADDQFLGEDTVIALAQAARHQPDAATRLNAFASAFYARAQAPIQDDLAVVWVTRTLA